jgi:insertion element IS1 protein InsB
MDRETRKIVEFHLGGRGSKDALKFWKFLLPVYRQCAIIEEVLSPSDLWKVYSEILPSKQHRTVDKESGETTHLERFNNTLRQRVSRLGRKILSFSKKYSHHLISIWYFIHHYNSNLPS